MEVKIKIVNMPESRMKTQEYQDWYQKIIDSWGGADYQLTRESVVDELAGMQNNDAISSFEHGIVVPYCRLAETDDSIGSSLGYLAPGDYDETTPYESAKMYIFDDGEVFYVHEGYASSSSACYSSVYGFDKEYDASQITSKLDEKLGKKHEVGKSKVKKSLIDKRKEVLLGMIKKKIKKGDYTESVEVFKEEKEKSLK